MKERRELYFGHDLGAALKFCVVLVALESDEQVWGRGSDGTRHGGRLLRLAMRTVISVLTQQQLR